MSAADNASPVLTFVTLGLREDKPTAKGAKPWKHYAFRCTLTLGRESFDFDYRMGTGFGKVVPRQLWLARHRDPETLILNHFGPGKDGVRVNPEPELADVLLSLCMDARSYDDAPSFEDWAGDFGYDADSREAERRYRACADTARDLRRVLGRKLYDEITAMDEDALRAWCNPPAPAPEGVRS